MKGVFSFHIKSLNSNSQQGLNIGVLFHSQMFNGL